MSARTKVKSARANAAVGTTLIFDADDTLWDTQPLYEESKAMFYRLMERSGFSAEEAASGLEMNDHANVAKFGFSKERFPQSMLDTYESLSKTHKRRVDAKTGNLAVAIGKVVFERSPKLLPGVKDTLSTLKSSRAKLILATKGDLEIQNSRVRSSGLQPYFERVYILKEKGVREFKKIILEESIPVSRGWSVGNSAKSDINPALVAGLNAVWIQRETWIYEADELMASQRLRLASAISEVPDIVLSGRG